MPSRVSSKIHKIDSNVEMVVASVTIPCRGASATRSRGRRVIDWGLSPPGSHKLVK